MALAASAGFAQSAGIQLITSGYSQLRSNSDVWARMSGSDTYKGATSHFVIDAFFSSSVDALGFPVSKLECLEYQNGQLTSRIVGDGMTLWAYNPVRNEYGATTYGASSANSQRQTALANLFNGFGIHAKGQTSQLARFLREVFAGNNAPFRPWIIGGQETLLVDPQSMDDPVLGPQRRYQADPATRFVVYGAQNSIVRSMAYQFEQSQQSAAWTLTKVFYADNSNLSGQLRQVEWQLTVQPVQLGSGNFAFVPPVNARPVVRPGGNLVAP